MVTKDQIFQGATFSDGQGDYMTLERVNEDEVYGCADSFDFSRNSIEDAVKALNGWDYEFIGVE